MANNSLEIVLPFYITTDLSMLNDLIILPFLRLVSFYGIVMHAYNQLSSNFLRTEFTK